MFASRNGCPASAVVAEISRRPRGCIGQIGIDLGKEAALLLLVGDVLSGVGRETDIATPGGFFIDWGMREDDG